MKPYPVVTSCFFLVIFSLFSTPSFAQQSIIGKPAPAGWQQRTPPAHGTCVHPGANGEVQVTSRDATGALSTKSYPPGTTVVSVMNNDSTVSFYPIDNTEEVDVIVQFRTPPLSRIGSMVKGLRTAQWQSALGGIEAEHARFRSDLPAIMAAQRSTGSMRNTAVQARIRFEYTEALNGMAITTTRSACSEISKLSYVASVKSDMPVKACDDTSNAVIGAPAFWDSTGLHGEGIDIGFIDTGIDYFHEALGGAPFPNTKVVGGYDIVNNDPDPMDDNGHGTHVAGIAAGDGPPPMNLRGVACKARIWAFKVLDDSGRGTFSQTIAGIERALDPDLNPETPTPIKVMNISLGGLGNPDDPVSQAVDNATAGGIVCAVAAGNYTYIQTINSPGCARTALTVGATDKHDTLAWFTSRGPSNKIFAFKPDVVAPGVGITSAKMGGGYITMSGTSMATPHVTGAAALLRQLHPDWPPAEIKAVLMETAFDISRLNINYWLTSAVPASAFGQGNGRIQLQEARQRSYVITPGNLHFGIDDSTQRYWTKNQLLTIVNHADTGQSFVFQMYAGLYLLPAGATVSIVPSNITVPAGQSASISVALTVDNFMVPNPQFLNTGYTSYLFAISASETTQIPFGFTRASMLRMIVDEEPYAVFFSPNNHTDNEILAYSPLWLGFINYSNGLDTLEFPVNNETYDIFGLYPEGNRLLLKEGIWCYGLSTISVMKGDSKNTVHLVRRDIDGAAVPLDGKGWMTKLERKSNSFMGLAIYSFSNPSNQDDWFLPDMSPDFRFEVNEHVYNWKGAYYRFLFGIENGLSSSVTLENDPSKLKKAIYKFPVADSVSQLFVYPSFEPGNGGITGYVANQTLLDVPKTIGPPFEWTGYYTPSPSQSYWARYSGLYTGLSSDFNSIFGKKDVYAPGKLTVTPDRVAQFWCNGLHEEMIYADSTDPLNVFIGRGAPIFTCEPFLYSSWHPMWELNWKNHQSYPLSGLFMGNHGEWTSDSLAFKGRLQNNTLISGNIPNPMAEGWGNESSIFNFTDYKIPVDMEFSFDQYRIGSVRGRATARFESPGEHWFTEPPCLENFQVLSNGAATDILNATPNDEIVFHFRPPDYKSYTGFLPVKSVEIFHQPLGTTDWVPGHVVRAGDNYSITDFSDVQGGYTSLRIRATDSFGGVLEYTLEPAFLYPRPLALSRNHVDFGRIPVRTNASDSVTVTNISTAPISIDSVTSDHRYFSVASAGCVIAPSESKLFPIVFTPLSNGLKTGTIIFYHDAAGPPHRLTVTGFGVGSEFTIPRRIVSCGGYPDSTTHDSLIVANTGVVDLLIDSVRSDNTLFGISPASGIIPPDSSLMFDISFSPRSAGIFSGRLLFTCEGGESIDTLTVLGSTERSIPVALSFGWNIFSNPIVTVHDSIQQLFPTGAEYFLASYTPHGYAWSLGRLNSGVGYWGRIPFSDTNIITGYPALVESVSVFPGWNLIGTIGIPIAVSVIGTNRTTITTGIYGYERGYHYADTLLPGKGYWVKADSAGTILLNAFGTGSNGLAWKPALSAQFAAMDAFMFEDATGNTQTLYAGRQPEGSFSLAQFELPPPGPKGNFDVRFASGRMAEVYPAQLNEPVEFPVTLSENSSPITVHWKLKNEGKERYSILLTGNGKSIWTPLRSKQGKLTINENSPCSVVLRVGEEILPRQYALQQNYPNPFNPQTTIRFDLPEDALVTLTVYDVLGRVVMPLAERAAYEAGRQEIVFDAGRLASGVYFYRMEATGVQRGAKTFTSVKKMALTK